MQGRAGSEERAASEERAPAEEPAPAEERAAAEEPAATEDPAAAAEVIDLDPVWSEGELAQLQMFKQNHAVSHIPHTSCVVSCKRAVNACRPCLQLRLQLASADGVRGWGAIAARSGARVMRRCALELRCVAASCGVRRRLLYGIP